MKKYEYKKLCKILNELTKQENELLLELNSLSKHLLGFKSFSVNERDRWRCIFGIEELENAICTLKSRQLQVKYLISKFESNER